jgi:hypothetical protein
VVTRQSYNLLFQSVFKTSWAQGFDDNAPFPVLEIGLSGTANQRRVAAKDTIAHRKAVRVVCMTRRIEGLEAHTVCLEHLAFLKPPTPRIFRKPPEPADRSKNPNAQGADFEFSSLGIDPQSFPKPRKNGDQR